MSESDELKSVGAFWGVEACGTHFVKNFRDDADFYRQYRAFRYAHEWRIPEFAEFEKARGLRVLEIGCGNGADGVMFARAGADYTGVDLTETAVEATRRHFAVENLKGEFRIENAERLSFADESFDIVYSYGVLHHTPRPERAFAEVHRVLKPGGRALLMLYHRRSFNYCIRILTYMRLRLLLEILARKIRRGEIASLDESESLAARGNETPNLWTIHCKNFQRAGWGYLRAANFAPHCTDGPECPYAFTYTAKEIRNLLSSFRRVETSLAHFPLRKSRLGRIVPRAVEGFIAARVGWHLLVRAEK